MEWLPKTSSKFRYQTAREKQITPKIKLWLNLPYNEKLGEELSTEQTNLLFFCPTNDRISRNQKANVMYIIQFFGCHNDNVGETDRNLVTRLLEHGKKEDQPMLQHFRSCEEFN